MRFPAMKRGLRAGTATPALTGGARKGVPRGEIGSGQLAEAQNVCYCGETLVSRPCFRARGTADGCGGELLSVRGGISFEGEAASVMLFRTGVGVTLRVIAGDGRALGAYTLAGCDGGAAVPGVEEPFLFFTGRRVYVPGDGELLPMPGERLTVPTVLVNARPYGEREQGVPADGHLPPRGEMAQALNRYCPRYRCLFTTTGDGENLFEVMVLPTPVPQSEEVKLTYFAEDGEYTAVFPAGSEGPVILQRGEKTLGGEIRLVREKGYAVTHFSLPAGGENNLCIEAGYEAEDADPPGFGMWLPGQNGGARLFLGGYRGQPAAVRWSETDDPGYFAESGVRAVGQAGEPVTAFGRQSDMLAVFKRGSTHCLTYADRETAGSGERDRQARGIALSTRTVSPSVGCDCPDTVALCEGKLVWMTSDARVHALVTASAHSNRNVVDVGENIAPAILGRSGVSERRAASARSAPEGYALAVAGRIYLLKTSDLAFRNLSYYYRQKTLEEHLTWVEWTLPDGCENAFLLPGSEVTLGLIREGTLAVYAAGEPLFGEGGELRDEIPGEAGETSRVVACVETREMPLGSRSQTARVTSVALEGECEGATATPITDGREREPQTFALRGRHTVVLPEMPLCHRAGVRLQSGMPLRFLGAEILFSPRAHLG